MKRLTALFLAALFITSTAYADDDVLLPMGPTGQPAAVTEDYQAADVERELAQEAAANSKDRGRLAEVKENWGFYVATDIGFYLAFGGARGYSNLQPYTGIKLGYDILKYFSLQLAVGNGYTSNNGITENDAKTATDPEGHPGAISSYQLTNIGLQAVGRFMPHERVALELMLGGGTTRISPLPRSQRPADNPQKESGWQGHFAAGLGVKYITLLTDFSAGLDISFYLVVPAKIPTLVITPTVRYTF